jgi:POT family proton-dependent oligopeptide transporter
MGINLGAFIATLLCAYLGETYGWRYGFGAAGIGMLIGLLTFIRGDRYLKGVGGPPDSESLIKAVVPGLNKERVIYLLSFMSVFLVWQIIQSSRDLGLVLVLVGLAVTGWLIWFSLSKCTSLERDRMLVMLALIALSVCFWALFEQAGSSLTLFTDRNVAMGRFFTAGMFQSLNPLFIIILAPLFAWLWVRMSQKNMEPSTPFKFGLGILQVGLGFAVLIFGASIAGPDGKVGVIWLALMYLLHTTGELCLSPVGLSMVTRLSVARVGGMMMGVWFLSSSFAAYVGGVIAGAMAIGSDGSDVKLGVQSLAVYTSVFEKLAMLAVGLGVLLIIVSPWLARRMHLGENKI